MDITWGNEWVEDTDNYTIPYNIPVYFNEVMENGYLNQIIINNDSDIWTKIFSKYEYLRNTSWSEESIMQQLSEYEAQIYDSGAYLRDMSRWPDGTYQNPELKLSEFKKYVHNRIVFTDGYMKHLKEFCNKTTLLRRTAYYEHFTESDFVIEINDHSLLNLPEYIDLFDYMGINISDISDNVRYIVGSPHNGYDYLNELCSPGTGIDTKAGYIEIKPSKYADASSGDLTLFIDDVPCCELWTDITPKARITFTYGGRGYYELNLAGDFTYKINQ